MTRYCITEYVEKIRMTDVIFIMGNNDAFLGNKGTTIGNTGGCNFTLEELDIINHTLNGTIQLIMVKLAGQ